MLRKITTAVIVWSVVLGLGRLAPPADAAMLDPALSAEAVRSNLFEAQLSMLVDKESARRSVADARLAYLAGLSGSISAGDPALDVRIRSALEAAATSVEEGEPAALAAARARVWTGLLHASYKMVMRALSQGDGLAARTWLRLREFRPPTRLSLPSTDATVAVEEFLNGKTSPSRAQDRVRRDLYDAYQERLRVALHELKQADDKGFLRRRAEYAALAQGYFDLLADAYQEQRGESGREEAERAFADLLDAALGPNAIADPLSRVEQALAGFRAAPLTEEEQARRAAQLQRFLSLVPVEYARGVRNGQVTKDFEIFEAIAFADGAMAAFADLQPGLESRDPMTTAEIAQLLSALEEQLHAAARGIVSDPDDIASVAGRIEGLVADVIPEEWLSQTEAGDFDLIATLLDQMVQAAENGEYERAESARLEAYAILETGPEARLVAFAPHIVPTLENLFWHGVGDHRGLAALIEEKAPPSDIDATRARLIDELAAAQDALRAGGSPVAVATNAAVIVFREGLEAVLILASLLAGLKRSEYRHLRRPLWLGAGASLLATGLTWAVMREALSSLARYGERLEAIVSLTAVGVLLLITNWFFHKSYWTDWLARFHAKKRTLLVGGVGQWLGMATLGFTSMYREGFETVLFLQALVFDAGAGIVLGGVGIGMLAVVLVGVMVFVFQTKLPAKKMLIVTGIMIGSVLMTMVGKTVHSFQLVGWMPTNPIRSVELPYWTGLWFGLYGTWEGILLQFGAALFVIGSYFLAESLQKRRLHLPAADRS